jgi:ectoine hydroxylase-related dioxygenase (phytanoyl-CoA dioxygenase family)
MNSLNLILLIASLSLIAIYILNRQVYEPGYVVIEKMIPEHHLKNLLKQWDARDFQSIKKYFLNNTEINQRITQLLGSDYHLIDYTYVIEDSSIHTFHRDYTSSRKYNGLSNPSYTMILYLDDSKSGLNLIPGSHKNLSPIYLYDQAVNLAFAPGSAIIFDADILHAGSVIDGQSKRHCIQFKIIHKDDVHKMPHLLNYHVLINRPNVKNIQSKNIEAIITKQFPVFMDLSNGVIKTAFSEKKKQF